MKIGYLGPPGSYSHEAACLYTMDPHGPAEHISLADFAAVVEAVETGKIDYGVLPVENSTYGAVATAMDLLLDLNESAVCGEVILDIDHCLLGNQSGPEQIRYVYSHYQAWEQCRRYFTSHHPHIEFIPCLSTSQACQLAASGGTEYGAVASKAAACLYHLAVMKECIQDNAFNQTRFLVIGRQPVPPSGCDKTSITFAFSGDRPGSLYSILLCFAEKKMNLTRVESRPTQKMLGEYLFYIDFEGHRQEELGAKVLRKVGEKVKWLKVLGSYPAANAIKEQG